jgi:hypothetical protein
MAEAPVRVKPDTIVMIRWAERHAGITVAEHAAMDGSGTGS